MATTKYQLLYRYINEATNTVITNDMANDYEMTFEFAADTHPFSHDGDIKAEEQKDKLLTSGNNAANPKMNMFFAYCGTKKIYQYSDYFDKRQESKNWQNAYCVFDVYQRIKLSPWMVNATYGSLEAALVRAKNLIGMIGIENVKLIKLVEFDQFVRIDHQ